MEKGPTLRSSMPTWARHTAPGHQYSVHRGSSNATLTLQPTTYSVPTHASNSSCDHNYDLQETHASTAPNTSDIDKNSGFSQTFVISVVPDSSLGFFDWVLHPCTFATKCHITQKPPPPSPTSTATTRRRRPSTRRWPRSRPHPNRVAASSPVFLSELAIDTYDYQQVPAIFAAPSRLTNLPPAIRPVSS